jgi:CheY-like chemotaxis protein
MQHLLGVRVVLVEDHEDTLEIFRQVLATAGAVVSAARCAQDAAVLLSSADVVVTDVAMPDRDGVWLLEEIRAKTPHVPVIAVSGYVMEQDARLAQADFDMLLLKPVDPWQLCEEIERLLRKRAAA